MTYPEPYWSAADVTLYVGDCREVLAGMPDASVDAIVCDPPYGLEFMGAEWDTFKPGGKRPVIGKPDGTPFRQNTGTPSWGASCNPSCRNCGKGKYDRAEHRRCRCDNPDFGNHMAGHMRAFQAWCEGWAVECLRVLTPGAHLVAFGGTRTYHRLAAAVEDAGFEVRDSLHWIYGSGFSKGINVAKAVEKAIGDSFAVWDGWNTTLKPAHEPIILARKPPAGTIAANVMKYGTGALNIAACRVEPTGESRPRVGEASQDRRYTDHGGTDFAPLPGVRGGAPEGRWPTNLVFSHSAACVGGGSCDQESCPVAELDRQSGQRVSGKMRAGIARSNRDGWAGPMPAVTGAETYGDTGGASRFFPVFRYEAKAPASERPKLDDGTAHATVKPLDLMRWLVRLVTPPGGVVLDPFAGSGTTGEACVIEGFRSVLIELDPKYAELIKRRLSKPLQPSLDLFSEVSDV